MLEHAKVSITRGYVTVSFLDDANVWQRLVLSLPKEEADYINLEIGILAMDELDLDLTHDGSQVIAYSNGWGREDPCRFG